MSRLLRRALSAAFWLSSPGAAWAHSTNTGMAAFYDGVLLVVFVPGLLLALCGYGLVLGIHQRIAERSWQAFAISSLAGLGAAWLGLDIAHSELPLLLLALAAGLFVASGLALPRAIALAGGAVIGFCMGAMSFPHPGTFAAMTLAALGALVGANVLLFYIAAVAGYLTEKLAREWIAIGLRVAGSWIAAISFIVLALSLSPAAAVKPDSSGTGGALTSESPATAEASENRP